MNPNQQYAVQNDAAPEALAQRAFFARDVLDFIARYPDMGTPERLAALERNPRFRQFCGSRFGREPLSRLYGDYLVIIGDAGSAAVKRAESRSARGTGGGSGQGMVLSPAERFALEQWNLENPEMKMSAGEYLNR